MPVDWGSFGLLASGLAARDLDNQRHIVKTTFEAEVTFIAYMVVIMFETPANGSGKILLLLLGNVRAFLALRTLGTAADDKRENQ